MYDIELLLNNQPGSLALVGNLLGTHRISLEGGGMFCRGNTCIAHYLIKEAEVATKLLTEAGIMVLAVHKVIALKLRQDVPGQLGLFCGRLADASINILVQYSDHDHQLIIVPDDYDRAKVIAADWMNEWWS